MSSDEYHSLSSVNEDAYLDDRYTDQIIRAVGEENYYELQRLAKRSLARSARRDRKKVLILPGIIGSRIGQKENWLRRDVIWISPARIINGDLADLKLPDAADDPMQSHGALIIYDLMLFQLRIAGYDAEYFDYDWRKSLTVSGRQLAERIEAIGEPVSLVAHSMGGQVVRAALAEGELSHVDQVITLGTPYQGSFSPAPVIRGTHSMMKKIIRLDRHHTAAELAESTFSTMNGFYEMLPFKSLFGDQHMYEMDRWPQSGPRPRAQLLAEADAVQSRLPLPDHRFTAIIGYDHQTMMASKLVDDTLIFTVSQNGDGAVPLASAHPPGDAEIPVYYSAGEHGALPADENVRDAVRKLLDGETDIGLETELPDFAAKECEVSEHDLGKDLDRDRSLEMDHDAIALDALSDFLKFDTGRADSQPRYHNGLSAEAGEMFGVTNLPPLNYELGGQQRRTNFELRILKGDIRDADTAAIAFGAFEDVEPMGAADAVDALLEGEMKALYRRRMIDARLGGVTGLPTARRPLSTELVLQIGLGHAATLSSDGLAAAAQNLVRYLIKARMSDCALILMGRSVGFSAEDSMRAILRGAFKAACDAPETGFFKGLTFYIRNDETFERLARQATRICTEAAALEPSTTLNISQQIGIAKPSPVRYAARREREAAIPEPVYVTADLNGHGSQEYKLDFTLLLPSGPAAAPEFSHIINRKALDAAISAFDAGASPTSIPALKAIGEELTSLVLPERLKGDFAKTSGRPIVLVHNTSASRIPWELLRDADDRLLCDNAGVHRRLATGKLSASKWLEQRQTASELSVLIIADPTDDLAGARQEATDLFHALVAQPGIARPVVLGGDNGSQPASKRNVLDHLSSGKYDLVHYAGHAYFNEQNIADSGLLCANHERVTGRDLANLASLPPVMFLNACQSARVRRRRGGTHLVADKTPRRALDYKSSFAEMVLASGVNNFIGTYWPVGDFAAETFASIFYAKLVAGAAIGDALSAARDEIQANSEPDWANYIHYGDHNFRLKDTKRRPI